MVFTLKKNLSHLYLYIFILLSNNIDAQLLKNILLPMPDTTNGLTLMKALKSRASANQFDTTSIKVQDLSNLLWAANGINRPNEKKKTAPSALNAQDIDIFVFIKSGIYLFDSEKQMLRHISNADSREMFSKKPSDSIIPPLVCLLISDISRFKFGNDSLKIQWAAMDAGMVSQNISLFCSSFGLSTRPRASMNKQKLKEILKLKDTQYIMLNHPVSYKLN